VGKDTGRYNVGLSRGTTVGWKSKRGDLRKDARGIQGFPKAEESKREYRGGYKINWCNSGGKKRGGLGGPKPGQVTREKGMV